MSDLAQRIADSIDPDDPERDAKIEKVVAFVLASSEPSVQKSLREAIRKESNGKSDFSPGDRVRLSMDTAGQFGTGRVLTAQRHPSGYFSVQVRWPNQPSSWVREDRLERVKSLVAKENNKPNFRVGDRVRTQLGGTGVVTGVQPDPNHSFAYQVRFHNGRNGTEYEDDLSSYTPPPLPPKSAPTTMAKGLRSSLPVRKDNGKAAFRIGDRVRDTNANMIGRVVARSPDQAILNGAECLYTIEWEPNGPTEPYVAERDLRRV